MRGDELAIGYTGMDRSAVRKPVKPFFTRGITAAAGFTSSVNDLARFASWQFRLLEDGGGDVIDSNTLREMHRVHWVDADNGWWWGLGFEIFRVDDDITAVGHGGGCPGYMTIFMLSEKSKLAIVVLSNAGDFSAEDMGKNILKTITPALKKAKKPSEDTIPDFSMYEGNYDVKPWGGEVAIRQWGDHLVAITIPSDTLNMKKLKHVEGDTFVRLTDDDETRESWVFELSDDGKAERIIQHSNIWHRVE